MHLWAATLYIVLPVLLGGAVGWAINRWWGVLVSLALALGGLLIVGLGPVDDDVPRLLLPATEAWFLAVGVAFGLFLRAMTPGREHGE
jgi:hypothetical protein